MSTYEYLQQLNNSDKKLFTTSDIEQLFEVNVKRTLEDRVKKLLEPSEVTHEGVARIPRTLVRG